MQKQYVRRLQFALSLALYAAVGAVAAVGAQGFSQPDIDFNGSVRASGGVVKAGDTVEISGIEFKPGQSITLLRGDIALNTTPYIADAEGRFSGSFALPDNAAIGRHPIVVRADNPDAATVFELKVSEEVPLSGSEKFDAVSNKLVQGLYQAAFSAKSNALFVTAAVGRPPVTQSELLKIDPETLEIIARVTPAQVEGKTDERVYAVYGVGVDDANGYVWVTNTRDDTAAVYRQSDLSLVKQFEPGLVPHGRDVVVDSKNRRVYASAFGAPIVAVFDAQTLEVLPPIEIQSSVRGETFSPMALNLDAEASLLYTVSMSTGEVAVIDSATGKVNRVFALPNANAASGVAVDAQGRRLFIASQGSDNLLIVDSESGAVLHDVYVGAGAVYVTFDPHSRLAFVPNRAAGTVTAVNSSGEIIANLAGGTFPNHIVTDGRGNMFAVNKSRGADDPDGDHVHRFSMKAN